jgi:hypothetical protein
VYAGHGVLYVNSFFNELTTKYTQMGGSSASIVTRIADEIFRACALNRETDP